MLNDFGSHKALVVVQRIVMDVERAFPQLDLELFPAYDWRGEAVYIVFLIL
jgi:hypothetical protein